MNAEAGERPTEEKGALVRIRSVRARLTLWYMSLLTLTFLALGGAAYGLLSYSLLQEVDKALKSVARVMAERTQEERSSRLFPSEIEEIFRRFFGVSPKQPYFQMLDPEGRTLDPKDLPLAEETLRNAAHGLATYETVDASGPYPVRILTVPVMRDGRPVRLIRVGSSLKNASETRMRFLVVMGGLFPVALILAGMGGWVLARRALRPVERMAEAARRISAERLAERVEETGAGDELDRLAQTLNQMLSRLDEAFQQVKRFSADASHELQTPLTALRGELEVALRSQRTPEEYQATLKSALEEIERIARLVEGLLLLARAESGALRMDRRPVDLSELAEEVFWRLKVLADERSVDLHLEETGPLVVPGDRDRLRRLLVNLVDNAVKYTGAGGRVTLSLSRNRDRAVMTVEDTGRGMPPKDLEHIFQPFFRSDDAAGEPGSGLGLSIAQSIAVAHGGDLTATSEPGRGSTFRVSLPASAPPA